MPEFSDIFTWEGWEDWGETKSFVDCVLMRDVGSYDKGEFFEMVFFNTETLTLKFYKTTYDLDNDTPTMVKRLGLVD